MEEFLALLVIGLLERLAVHVIRAVGWGGSGVVAA